MSSTNSMRDLAANVIDKHLQSKSLNTKKIGQRVIQLTIPISQTSKMYELTVIFHFSEVKYNMLQCVIDRSGGYCKIWSPSVRLWHVCDMHGRRVHDVAAWEHGFSNRSACFCPAARRISFSLFVSSEAQAIPLAKPETTTFSNFGLDFDRLPIAAIALALSTEVDIQILSSYSHFSSKVACHNTLLFGRGANAESIVRIAWAISGYSTCIVTSHCNNLNTDCEPCHSSIVPVRMVIVNERSGLNHHPDSSLKFQ